jgi:uncharacterized protein (DUF924 family)
VTTIDRDVLAGIHRFWFGELRSPGERPPKEISDRWFSAKPEFDAELETRFARYLVPARTADWDLGRLSRIEQVGLILLLDQLPRNIFRKGGEAFASDAKALSLSRELMRDGGIARFFPVERTFVALPFMHSENLEDQDFGCSYFAAAVVAAAPEYRDDARNGLDYAYKHWSIIRKFGRFPHRNEVLGRQSTPEEIEFLKGGRGF